MELNLAGLPLHMPPIPTLAGIPGSTLLSYSTVRPGNHVVFLKIRQMKFKPELTTLVRRLWLAWIPARDLSKTGTEALPATTFGNLLIPIQLCATIQDARLFHGRISATQRPYSIMSKR